MNITIKINCNNDAFVNAESAETARILNYLAEDIIAMEGLDIGLNLPLFDSNGNKVGSFKVTE